MRSGREFFTAYLTKPYQVSPPGNTNWQDIGGGQIGTDQIFGQAITEAQLKDGSISSAKIGTISADDISTGTLSADRIAAGSITGTKLANSTVTGSKIDSSTITGSNIAGTTITASNIANSTITGGKIAAGTITASNIAAGTITATQIAAGTITGSLIAAGTITAADIATNTITTTEIATSTITGNNINAASTTFSFGRVNIGGSFTDPLNVVGVAAKTGGGSWATLSDKRLKDHIGDVGPEAIELVGKLKPVRFKYKDRKLVGGRFEKDRRAIGDREWMGFYAQDYAKVFPDAVKERNDGYLQLDVSGIEALLTAAVQEQQKEIEALRAELKALRDEIKGEN